MDLTLPVGPRDHVRGPREARVTVVEYADVECPYCQRVEPVLRDLLAQRDDVRLVYRHFPLVGPHPHAYSAALALEAAAVQGRFWELHDLLFGRRLLGRTGITSAARELDLEPEALLRPASERWDAKVRDDYGSGVASGVEGTPALFVNGVLFQGGPSLRRVLEAVDRA